MRVQNHAINDTNGGLKPILELLLAERGFDFAGSPAALLARRIELRRSATQCQDLADYRSHLDHHPGEMDQLIATLTINVSQFFRNPLTFELLAERLLPDLLREKARQANASLRVWSAGCARGEEIYSVAMLLEDLVRKEKLTLPRHLFATDIDAAVLRDAAAAVYPRASVENVRHRHLSMYFQPDGDGFRVIPEIRRQVDFSFYDMLDRRHRVPPESVFGHFDLVLCRNLLIYFNADYQETLLAKLHQALCPRGWLVLGEAEAPPPAYRRQFKRVAEFSTIYQKQT